MAVLTRVRAERTKQITIAMTIGMLSCYNGLI